MDAASVFVIGVSGSKFDAFMMASLAPEAVVTHNDVGVGELPTMKLMHMFCQKSPNWNVLYLHTKGAIYNGDPTVTAWRKCMENAVIWQWQRCVNDLSFSIESVGAHWLTPAKYPIIGDVPYWGGNFFWAKSEFLAGLPEIDINADRYQAEVWIGKGRRPPRIRDYAMHWPGAACCK